MNNVRLDYFNHLRISNLSFINSINIPPFFSFYLEFLIQFLKKTNTHSNLIWTVVVEKGIRQHQGQARVRIPLESRQGGGWKNQGRASRN